MLDIVETDKGYEVKFAYKPYLVSAIKQIPGIYFIGAKKAWGVPKRSEVALLNWAKRQRSIYILYWSRNH